MQEAKAATWPGMRRAMSRLGALPFGGPPTGRDPSPLKMKIRVLLPPTSDTPRGIGAIASLDEPDRPRLVFWGFAPGPRSFG